MHEESIIRSKSDTRNNRNLIIRELKIFDVVRLYKMYKSLSNETKRFFHPFPESTSRSFLTTWIALSLSSIKVLRRLLLKTLPQFVYISLCSIYLGASIAVYKKLVHPYSACG
jgi:hypothetical protein